MSLIKSTAVVSLLASSLVFSSFAVASDKHHFPGIFLGATHADSNTEFTYGLEYEYKFNQNFGAGLVYEKTDEAHHGDGTEVKLASVYYHPIQHVRLGAGFGEEKVKGHHSHTEDLYRLSASYEIAVGEFEIAPTIAFDFIDGDTATILGVGIVRAF